MSSSKTAEKTSNQPRAVQSAQVCPKLITALGLRFMLLDAAEAGDHPGSFAESAADITAVGSAGGKRASEPHVSSSNVLAQSSRS